MPAPRPIAAALAAAGAWLLDPAEPARPETLTAPAALRPVVAVFGLAHGCGTTVVARALAAELARRDPFSRPRFTAMRGQAASRSRPQPPPGWHARWPTCPGPYPRGRPALPDRRRRRRARGGRGEIRRAARPRRRRDRAGRRTRGARRKGRGGVKRRRSSPRSPQRPRIASALSTGSRSLCSTGQARARRRRPGGPGAPRTSSPSPAWVPHSPSEAASRAAAWAEPSASWPTAARVEVDYLAATCRYRLTASGTDTRSARRTIRTPSRRRCRGGAEPQRAHGVDHGRERIGVRELPQPVGHRLRRDERPTTRT